MQAHNSEKLMWWSPSSGRIEIELRLADALSCSAVRIGNRDALPFVEALLKIDYIKAQADKLLGMMETVRQELKEYGTWSAQDLDDSHMNIVRMFWLASCDIAEKQCDEQVA